MLCHAWIDEEACGDRTAQILVRFRQIGDRSKRIRMKKVLEQRDAGCTWNDSRNPESAMWGGFHVALNSEPSSFAIRRGGVGNLGWAEKQGISFELFSPPNRFSPEGRPFKN
jgi:hypothetical protein